MRYFKYRGGYFERDLKSLEENYFWASEISSLNDPYEFMVEHEFYRPQLDLILQILSGDNIAKNEFNKVHNQLEALVAKTKECGIFSLSKNYADELLWAHYAGSHQGFCIELDSELLKRNFNKYFYNFLEVKYSEVIPKIEVEDFLNLKTKNENFLQKLVATKSKRWDYEEEVRFVMEQPGKHYYDFRSVKGIYFGLRMDDAQKKILMKCMEGRGIKYYQMELENKSYKLNPRPVKDLFSDAPKYLYKVAPVMEDPVSENEVKESYKHLIP